MTGPSVSAGPAAVRGIRANTHITPLQATNALPARLVDSHHHFLDPSGTASGSDFHATLQKLGAPAYFPEDLKRDAGDLWPIFSGTVHVEAMASNGAGEAAWVDSMAESGRCPIGAIVGSVNLADDDVSEQLSALAAASPRVRGVRWILDHDGVPHGGSPSTVTHVACARPAHVRHGGDYLREPAALERFERGYAQLAAAGLSFDLQCCPAQLPAAAALARRHPDVPVVIDHCGKVRALSSDGSLDDAALDEWRAGMGAMAALPHAYVKLSMFGWAVPGWTEDSQKEAIVRDLVRELIALFGAQRCMFASNWHINGMVSNSDAEHSDIGLSELLGKFASWVADYSEPEREALFAGTAQSFYRM